MNRRHRIMMFVVGLGLLSLAAAKAEPTASATHGSAAISKLPLQFFENRGQLDQQVEWAGVRGGLAAFFTADSFTIRLDEPAVETLGETAYRGAVLRYAFEGASPAVDIAAEEPTEARFNFLRGPDPSAWRTGIPGYGAVRYRGLYDGVDLVVRDLAGEIEYDFVLAPGATLDQVRIRCEGADSLWIDGDGTLVAGTRWGDVKQTLPQSWQLGQDGSRREIESRFVMLGDRTYGFATTDCDPNATTVIDPGITYSTYLGGSNGEHGCGCSIDDLCGCYVTGDTLSVNFPTVVGSFDLTHNGDVDVFVTRLNPNLTQLLYSTFLGGSLGDFGHGVAVTPAGVAHVSGGTRSSNFPVTGNAFDGTLNGSSDAFLARLSLDGDLQYSTYLGGTGDEGSFGGQVVALDSLGRPHLTGFANSVDFPTTVLASDGSHNGSSDMFVTRFSLDGTLIGYSTFTGGSGVDVGNVIDIDNAGNAYIGGSSASVDFPVTPGAYQTAVIGPLRGVVTKLSPDGTNVLYSTYTGGDDDVVRGISVVGDEAVAGGYTLSPSFPTTAGAFDTTPDGSTDGFVLRLNAAGSAAVFATLLGGTASDGINDVDTDANGQAYASGWTDSTDFPVTAAVAFDSTPNGGRDTFCTRFAVDGSAVDYSTYIGGSGDDVAFAIHVHDVAAFYVVGGTYSTDFPTTTGVFDETANGNEDVFVVLMPAGNVTCTTPAAANSYGTGEADSSGNVLTLTALNLPQVPSPGGVQLALTNATPNAATFFFVGMATASAPIDQGTLLVTPTWIFALGSTSATGTLNVTMPIADNPNYCGDDVFVQAAVVDPNLITFYQLVLSNGVQLTFGA